MLFPWIADGDLLGATRGLPPKFDSGRIQRDLGLTFTNTRGMAEDMVRRLEEVGVVRPCRK